MDSGSFLIYTLNAFIHEICFIVCLMCYSHLGKSNRKQGSHDLCSHVTCILLGETDKHKVTQCLPEPGIEPWSPELQETI